MRRLTADSGFGCVQTVLCAALVAAMAMIAGSRADAAPLNQDPLNYTRGFLVNGNYIVGGVDLGVGTSTGTIAISGVPPGADIVAAFLYWESIYDPTVFTASQLAAGVRFRGTAIDAKRINANTVSLQGKTAQCWSAPSLNGNAMLTMYRADVLNLLPKLFDANNRWTGKLLVNSADLSANVDRQGNVFSPNTVTLPNGNGNNSVQSAGAALVIVYRNQADPLTKIVFYDGVYAQTQPSTLAQNLRGFYGHAGNGAKLTHIVGTGGNNSTVQLLFNNNAVALNPFPLQSASGRTLAFPTFSYPQFAGMSMTGTAFADGFGETATTTVGYGNTNQNACLAWAGIVFSTPILDADNDGLPDALEASSNAGALPWQNPDGQVLPDLHAMGATADHKDLFVEIDAMRTDGPTNYGSATAPFDSTTALVTIPAHSHLPVPESLTLLGDAFANAPIQNLDNTTGIRAHFDVGNRSVYLGSECTFDGLQWHPNPVCQYLVPTLAARGGETIAEASCPTCRFPDYPGTVGWKFAFELYRDAPVDDNGNELTTPAQISAWQAGGAAPYRTQRRRFDVERRPYFHYALFAHAQGKPKSLPCILNGQPADYAVVNGVAACAEASNPTFDPLNYHVPSSTSGIADLPGGNILVTLGLWDKVSGVGSAFVNASTALHELGHNLALWHGGRPTIVGSKALNTPTYIEPNCKPNYQSSMSYLFQAHGLVDKNFELRLNYSGAAQTDLDEHALSDLSLSPASVYQPTWFAPAASALASLLGANAATKLCNGVKFAELANPPATSMARVWAPFLSPSGDWNVKFDWFGDDFTQSDRGGALNVNYDGVFGGSELLSDTLFGADDWDNVQLTPIGAVRSVTTSSSGDTDVTSGDTDIASGDTDVTSGDTDISSGDTDISSGDTDIASGDTDIASGDTDVTSGAELDFETAKNMGRTPPPAFRACILGADPATEQGCSGAWTDNNGGAHATQPSPGDPMYHRVYATWKVPSVGNVTNYLVYRLRGSAVPANWPLTAVLVGTPSRTSVIDTEELPNGVPFTYFAEAAFLDRSTSGVSNFALINAAVDVRPVTAADSYTVGKNGTLKVPASAGVLSNDRDADSPQFANFNTSPAPNGRGVAVLVAGPSNAALNKFVLNADGSFTYAPKAGFVGTDTFTYVANDGKWIRDGSVALSPDSVVTTVTITVSK